MKQNDLLHPSIDTSVHWLLNTPAATQRWGEQLGEALCRHLLAAEPNDPTTIVIALHGELGAGKTTLTQGIATGLGICQPVTSPTFTLINEYEAQDGIALLHIDGYRLGGGENAADLEAMGMGLDELLLTEKAAIVIEWAARVEALLPPDHLSIHLRYADVDAATDAADRENHRWLVCQCSGPQSAELLGDVARRLPPSAPAHAADAA